MNHTLFGERVFLSPLMTRTEFRPEPRTWRERLFTRPWRPWEKTKLLTVTLPSEMVVRTAEGLFMHPEMWSRVSIAIKQQAAKGIR